MKTNFCFTFMLIALFAITSLGQSEVVAGQIYSEGQTVSFSSIGCSFTIPPSWRGGLPEGGEAFVLDRTDGTASMMVTADHSSWQEVETTMNGVVPLDDFTMMNPQGTAVRSGNIISNSYVIGNGVNAIQAFAVATVSQDGLMVVAICLASGSIDSGMRSQSADLIKSVKFYKPKVDSQVDTEQSVSDWSSYMKGRYIEYMKTGSGYSENEKIWLCGDGTFARSHSDSYVSSDAVSDFSYVGANGERYGKWKVQGNDLLLNYDDGSVGTYTLLLTDDGLYLNGRKWFRLDNERCQ